jgi:hypothetical protein
MNKWARRFLYFIASIISLVLVLFLLLQTDWAKNVIRKKIQAYVSTKTNTEFLIGSLDYSLPSWVELNGVLMRDLNKDTLIYGNRIKANVAMLTLLKGKYEVDKILLDNFYVNLTKKDNDTVFNYQFVIDAFKSKSAKASNADTGAIDLSLKELTLKNVRFNLLDDKTGSYTRMSVKDMSLKLKNLDVNKMNFDIEHFFADEFKLQILIKKESTDTVVVATHSTTLPILIADSLNIINSYVSFIDEVNHTKSINSIGLLQVKELTNKDNPQILTGKFIQLANSNIEFDHTPAVKPAVLQSDTITLTNNLAVVVDEMLLQNNRIIYNNNNAPLKINGLDYSHLDISELQLKAVNNQYNNGLLQSTISSFSFKDKSGFQLDSLRGDIKLDSGNIAIKNLFVKTPGSTVRANAMIYPLSFSNTNNSQQPLPQNTIEITNTIISKKDLDLLADGFTEKYKKQMNALGDLLINASLVGNARHLLINDLNLRSTNGKAFVMHVSGIANDVIDNKKLSYNFNIKNLTASRDLIQPFLKDIKQPINLPPVISVTGLLAGNMNRLQTNLSIVSAFGKATAKGSLIHFQYPAQMQYDMLVNATNLETGKWIYQDSLLGKITGTIAAKGANGFDIKTNTIQTTANISSFRLQQNEFNNIKLNVMLVRGIADFIVSVNDELLQVNAKGKSNIKTDYPTVQAVVNLQKADLYALGFVQDSLQISTLATIDLKNSSPQNLDAVIRLDSVWVDNGQQKIYTDSALLLAFVRNDSTIISLTSSLADADVASNLTYLQMPDLLSEVMEQYFPTGKHLPVTQSAAGTIVAAIYIKPDDQYQSFVKDISFNNVLANIAVTNQDKDSAVKAHITATQIQIGTNKVSNLDAVINGTADSLLLVLKADTLHTGKIILYDALVNAGFNDNNITAAIRSNDNQKTEQFALGIYAAQNQSTNGYDIHLKDALTLNYQKWQVNEQNMIRTSSEGFNVKDFDISDQQQKISLNSTTPSFNAPLIVAIDAFKLSTITALLNQDSLLVEGLLNAHFTISNFAQPIPTIDGKLQLDSIVYQQKSVGNLQFNASSNGGQVKLDGKLDGNSNNVDMSGTYNAQNIDIKLNLHPLELSSVQPFVQKYITRSTGTITGPINISGTISDPTWSGLLSFDGVQTTATEYGTFLKIDGQKIALQYPVITFNNFTVLDSTGNSLKINGTLTETKQQNFVTDLNISASNFNVINSTAVDNNMIYGKAIVGLDTDIKGLISAPELSGNVVIKNGTEVTYVVQNTATTLEERDQLIEFVDMDTISNLITHQTFQELARQNEVIFSPLDHLKYNLNLEVEPKAKFNIILDPSTRDELQVQGQAQVNLGINPNGDIVMAGTYNLKGGSYQLNYGLIKRKFILLDGSTIRLSGDPLNAEADITASYEISTPPIDLIGNEVGATATGSTTTDQYKRKVPFLVLLKIKGTVSKPELSFDIVIKEKVAGITYELSNTIETKLQQLRTDPSSMNKQVFALLTLSRFIPDQSSNFFGGNSLVNTNLLANESVSGFLNAAVDQLAADLIKGVDIDINLKSVDDDPSAKRTDLNVALGKSFLNDRLNVTVGKSFTVDGTDPSSKGNNGNNNNLQFVPDVNATYKLSKDGRYMLRAYRRNQYEAIMDGYFIETGLTFSFTMDYNKFKELFRKNK